MELILEDIGLRQSLVGDTLKFMPDFLQLARKFEQMRGSLQVMLLCTKVCHSIVHLFVLHSQDCVCVYQALLRLPPLISVLSGCKSKHRVLLKQQFVVPLKVS